MIISNASANTGKRSSMKSRFVVFLTSLALIASLCPTAAYAQEEPALSAGKGALSTQETRTTIESGYYVIQSAVGSKVLEVAGASKKAGANARIYQPRGTASQIFQVVNNAKTGASYIKLKASGKVLGTPGGLDGNVQQWTKSGAASQMWTFEDAGSGWVYIRNLYGYYLDVSGGTDANKQNVQMWSFNGGNAQKWKFVKVSGKTRKTMSEGNYTLKSATGSRVLDVNNASYDNGANLQIWDYNGSIAQTFSIGWNASAPGYHIKNTATGKLVSTSGNANGTANVHQWEQGVGANGDNWIFEDAGNGYVYIRNLWGYYLDAADAKDTNGTNVQVWTYSGSVAQKWKLAAVNPLNMNGASIGRISAKTYTGKALKPNPKVTYNGKTLKKGIDYTLSYKKNKAIGKAKVTVKGKGFYTGTKSASFTIKMRKPTVSVKRKSTGSPEIATVKWKFKKTKVANSQISGFKIQLKSKGNSVVKSFGKKSKEYRNRSCLIGLSSRHTTYTVRIYAYKKVGKKTYGAWSKTVKYRSA